MWPREKSYPVKAEEDAEEESIHAKGWCRVLWHKGREKPGYQVLKGKRERRMRALQEKGINERKKEVRNERT